MSILIAFIITVGISIIVGGTVGFVLGYDRGAAQMKQTYISLTGINLMEDDS